MPFLSLLQRLSLLVACMLALAACPALAQTTRHYASHVVMSRNTSDPHLATGSDMTTQATLSPSLLLGTALLRLGFPSLNPAGSKAGLIVDAGGALTLAALNGVVINTYLAPSTTPQQTIQLNQLLTLQAANGGPTAVEFTSTKPFDQLELAAGGLLNVYSLGLVMTYADQAGPLPVELVAFAGKATRSGVQLSWQTASELHNAYFAIERAREHDVTFTELGRIAGGGTATLAHFYQFTDVQVSPLAYYRLRQVDLDGQVHYSPVVVVQQAVASGLVLYPNPASATLVVSCPSGSRLGLFNIQGQLLQQVTLAAGQQTLDIRQLGAGSYYLRDTVTGQSIQFVKVSNP
jgi:hypothetical protein